MLAATIAPAPPKSEFESGYDRNFAPAKPTDYSLPRIQPKPGDAGFVQREQANHENFRSWLAAGEFSAELGTSLAQTIKNQGDDVARIGSVDALEKYLNGEEKYAANIKLANDLVDKIEKQKPGLKAYLKSSRAGNSAAVILQMHGQAVRLMARKGSL